MRFASNTNTKDIKFFMKYILPKIKQFGIPVDIIDLIIYINHNPYKNPDKTKNEHLQHFNPNLPQHIFFRIVRPEEFVGIDGKPLDYEIYLSTQPYKVFFHELTHWFQYNFIGKASKDNPKFMKMVELINSVSPGAIDLKFHRKQEGNYSSIEAEEDLANYCDDLFMDNIKNEPLRKFILEMLGVEYKSMGYEYNGLIFTHDLKKREETTHIVIHHDVWPGGTREDIHQSHINRDWSGFGYHARIRQDGVIELGRPLWAVGAHTKGLNTVSIGVVVEGNYNKQKVMPEPQISSLIGYIKKLIKTYGPLKIAYHNQFSDTDCPGKYFPYTQIEEQFKFNNNYPQDIKGHWAEEAIKSVINAGYMGGFEDGTFRPDETVTRAQLASVISRIIEKE